MATPTLVQYSTFSSSVQSGTSKRLAPLPNTVLSGNAVFIGGQCSGGAAPSAVTDDKGNTYSLAINRDDGSQNVFIYFAVNVTNGPKTIEMDFSSPTTFVGFFVAEFYNIVTTSIAAAKDGTGHGNSAGSGTALTAGSFTTGTAGDLIIAVGVQDSTSDKITSWTKGSGFTLLCADTEDSLCVEYQIQAAAGAINAAMSMSPTHAWNMIAFAFKNATAGTAPTVTPRVIGVHHQALDRLGSTGPYTKQFPIQQGDLLYVSCVGLHDYTSLTDSLGNTYTASGASIEDHSGGATSGTVRCFYCKVPTLSGDMVLTINTTGSGTAPGDTIMFFECIGVAGGTWSFDAHFTRLANATGTSYTGPATTPVNAPGLVFTTGGQQSNTTLSCNTGFFISSTDPIEETSPWPNDENNPWSYQANASTAQFTVTFTTDAAAASIAIMADCLFSAVVSTGGLFKVGLELSGTTIGGPFFGNPIG